MPRPETAVERWILREGWYFLGWTINRKMVRRHDTFGWWLIGLAPVASILTALFTEPVGAVAGIGIAAGGIVHVAMARWANKHPDVRPEPAPALTRRARKLLDRAVRSVAGTDPFGQKYYTKFVRQTAETAKGSASDSLNAVALAGLEDFCQAYNRAAGTLQELGQQGDAASRALQEAMAKALDLVAAIEEFPERWEPPRTQLDALIAQVDRLQNSLEAAIDPSTDDVRDILAAWTDVLHQEPEVNVQSVQRG